MKKASKIALVIPCHNESLHISSLLKKIQRVTKNMIPIIVVDDGSTDQTVEKASFHSEFVLHHQVNLGKGAALKTGCEFAFDYLEVDYIIMMDADEQHSPDDLYKFIDKIENNQQLVLGVRSFKGMPKGPVFVNRLTSLLLQVFYQKFIPDILSGYKSFGKSLYEEIRWQASGYEVEIEIAKIIGQQQIPFVTVPIRTIYPSYVRGMTFLDGIKVLFKIIGLK